MGKEQSQRFSLEYFRLLLKIGLATVVASALLVHASDSTSGEPTNLAVVTKPEGIGSNVFLVDSDSCLQVRLTDTPTKKVILSSVDGKTVVLQESVSYNSQLELLYYPNTGFSTSHVRSLSEDAYLPIALSPDGSHYLYVKGNQDPTFEVLRLRDDTRYELSIEAIRQLPHMGDIPDHYSFSRVEWIHDDSAEILLSSELALPMRLVAVFPEDTTELQIVFPTGAVVSTNDVKDYTYSRVIPHIAAIYNDSRSSVMHVENKPPGLLSLLQHIFGIQPNEFDFAIEIESTDHTACFVHPVKSATFVSE